MGMAKWKQTRWMKAQCLIKIIHIYYYYCMLVRVWGLGIQNKVDESERLRRWRKYS
jgi:hypothetical protein